MRTEFNRNIFVTLALEDIHSTGEAAIGKILRVYENTVSHQYSSELESEYVEKDHVLEIGRAVKASYLDEGLKSRISLSRTDIQEFGSVPALKLNVGSPGLLDSLYFSEDDNKIVELAPGEIEVEVKSVGVNFRDCLIVLGQMDTTSLGAERAGVITRTGVGCELQPGDRVAAGFTDTYQTYARGPEANAMKIPEDMCYTEASVVPVIFVTAWHALNDVAHLQKGESVLIHAGAGGTGQAAIQIARHLGAKIFTTVGSNEKKRLLIDTYGILEDHILYDRDTTFAQGIMRLTRNRGVDVVLNSLSGENLWASWECLSEVSTCCSGFCKCLW